MVNLATTTPGPEPAPVSAEHERTSNDHRLRLQYWQVLVGKNCPRLAAAFHTSRIRRRATDRALRHQLAFS